MRDVTAVVLCGGEGSRMGRVAKPLLSLCGQPLLAHVLARVRPQVDAVLLSTQGQDHRYGRFAHPCVEDGAFSGRGPLAGFAAGLAAATTNDVLVVPGDAPRLPSDLVARLDAARSGRMPGAAVAFDGVGLQPLCCLVPRALHGSLLEYLATGGNAPREWLQRCAAVAVDFPEVPGWAWSVNTPAEWSNAEQQLSLPEP